MNKISKFFHYLVHSPSTLMGITLSYFDRIVSDKVYIQLMFRLKVGYRLDLDNPKTFNEKINWLKLYDRQPQYIIMADKFLVKDYVANIIGSKYVVPNYGVWDKFENIDFTKLPNSFVLKCTHDSSGAIICKDKTQFKYAEAKDRIKQVLKRNYYYMWREWPYKNIKPRIIADMFLNDNTGEVLRDYKFWCFNGVPKIMYCTVKGVKVYENFYDMQFDVVTDINHGFQRHIPEFDKPVEFDIMKDLAAKLSTGIPFVRVDFFDVAGRVYFGEFTFYDWAGFKPFLTKQMDLKLGSLMMLPQ